MTSEEFEEISHECGYNTVRDSGFTICQAPGNEFWMAVYERGMVSVNKDFTYAHIVVPVHYKVYKLGMRKKVYRNYLLRMKRRYKNAQVELKKYRIEKDFE